MATKRASKTPADPSQSRGMSPAQPVAAQPGMRAASPSEVGSPAARPSYDAIARRAYDIWRSGKGGSDFDNWVQAERELRSGR